MITIYKEESKRLVNEEHASFPDGPLPKGSWIDVVEPNADIIEKLSRATSIPLEMLLTALDEEESARVDGYEGSSLIVLDAPYIENPEKGLYSTSPFIIAYNRDYFVTLSRHKNELKNELFKKAKKVEPRKHVRLALSFVYRLATLFISYLKKIDQNTKTVEKKLHSSMKNRELFELMDINKVLVYFSTALNADKGVLSKLLRLGAYKKFETDSDLMEDAAVELDQAIEMCAIYRDILAGMMDAFASIISNNLNIVMKTFAIITIVISIPTLIASFFGMNFSEIPLYDHQYGFWIVIGASIALALIGTVILIYAGQNRRIKPRNK